MMTAHAAGMVRGLWQEGRLGRQEGHGRKSNPKKFFLPQTKVAFLLRLQLCWQLSPCSLRPACLLPGSRLGSRDHQQGCGPRSFRFSPRDPPRPRGNPRPANSRLPARSAGRRLMESRT